MGVRYNFSDKRSFFSFYWEKKDGKIECQIKGTIHDYKEQMGN